MPLLLMVSGLACFVAGMTLHGDIDWFIDGPTLGIVLMPALCFAGAFHSVRGVTTAIRVALKNDAIPLYDAQPHVTVLQSLRALLRATSFIGFIIGIVLILHLVDTVDLARRATAVALLCPLYGMILAELFVHPLVHRLERRTVVLSSAEP